MNIKKTTLLFFLISTVITSAFAQRDTISLNTILAKTAKITADLPIEKVYLHLDKPYYAATDTIWFKAYITIDKHQLSGLSSIVFVDITNSQDSVMQELTLPVKNGIANGNFALSALTYKEGNYHLRAYTTWMRNFDPDYFFNKNIVIGNPVDNAVNTTISFNSAPVDKRIKIAAGITYKERGNVALANKKVAWSVSVYGEEIGRGKGTTDAAGLLNLDFTGDNTTALQTGTLTTVIDTGGRKSLIKTFSLKAATGVKDVQFLPEGGDLIVGVRSKVAFKAIGTNGLGIDIKGNITDNAGAEVAAFTSQHLGMGVFALLPEDGKTYKANVIFADGSKKAYQMPRIRPAGIVMALYNNDPANLTLKISASTPYFTNNQNNPYYIIAQIGGAVFFAAKTTLQNPVYSAVIPKSKFPTGIIQFTLFTGTGVPISERIVFIQNNDALNLSLTADKKIYTPHQAVKVLVSAKNKIVPAVGTFSVSVVNESMVPFDENAETTILSNLLLTSDLKGYIEKPNYYFLPKNTTAAEDLDVLMLTQGYRRISFPNIISDKFPPINLLPQQDGLEVSGTLRNNTGLPIAKGNLHMQIPGKASVETYTDMVGNFKFSKLTFPDSAQLAISARNNINSKNLVITVNGDQYQPVTKNNYIYDEVTNIDSAFKPYLANSKKVFDNQHVLKEVVIKATVFKKSAHLDYPGFAGLSAQADQTIGGEVLKGCPSLYNCLASLVLGITFNENLFYFSRNFSTSDKAPIQIFLNGKPVDASALDGIKGDEVDNIEVFKSDGLTGINRQYGTSGIIMVNTKKVNKTKISYSQLQDLIPKPYEISFKATGYSASREFYSPKYTVIKSTGFAPDLRTTVYWSPKITTDKTGVASFDFFNADGRGTYRATIEGIDAEGNLGRYVLRYTVK